MAQTLKRLKDSAKFRLSEHSPVTYTLNKLDHKKKLATYTSDKSGRTFVAGWGKEVWV